MKVSYCKECWCVFEEDDRWYCCLGAELHEMDYCPGEDYTNEKVEEVTQKATEAFWKVVAESFPNIKHGDFDPVEQMRMDENNRRLIELWITWNI